MTLNTHLYTSDLLDNLKTRGFNKTFELKDNKLSCIQSNKDYTQKDLKIVEYHRVNGKKNQPESRIIFALECSDGTKGCLNLMLNNLNGMKLLIFMDKVKIQKSKTLPS